MNIDTLIHAVIGGSMPAIRSALSEMPKPTPTTPAYTPPSQPQAQPQIQQPPSVASVSTANETRKKAKAKSGKSKTLLSDYGSMTRTRRSTTNATASTAIGLTEATKKSLLGSVG